MAAHRARKLLVPLLAGLALVAACATSAQANGAFPAVSQLVSDPSEPAHLVLRSNFGLLITHDRGTNWDWVCEAGLGYQNLEPAIAVLGDGTTIAALPNGVARGDTECSFGLGAGISSYVADVARIPNDSRNVAAVAVSVQIDDGVSQVWRSLDAGKSWSRWGMALNDFNATTLDVAADGSNTLYVSGISQSDTVTGVLAELASAIGDLGQRLRKRRLHAAQRLRQRCRGDGGRARKRRRERHGRWGRGWAGWTARRRRLFDEPLGNFTWRCPHRVRDLASWRPKTPA